MIKVIKQSVETILSLVLFSLVIVVSADDTDIINTESSLNSNILFVVDMSGSMQFRLADDELPVGAEKSRKDVLHDAFITVLNAPELTALNVKVGLSSFAGDTAKSGLNQVGHGISYPVTLLTADAAPRLDSNVLWDHQTSTYDGETITSYLPLAGLRTSIGYMGDTIPAGWTPWGTTPIVDALYEAALYFRGSAVDFGKADPSQTNSAHPSTYTGLLYDKTIMVDVPTLQKCGGTTGLTCNATVDSCPKSVVASKNCIASDPICSVDAEVNGYVCGAPYTPPTSYRSCDLAECSASVGCDIGRPSSGIQNLRCTLSSATACEAANPTWDVGSCKAQVIPEIPGVCNSRTGEGVCNGYASPTPETTVYDCTKTKLTYNCPYFYPDYRYCEKSEPVCRNTIQVPTASKSLTGTATYNSPIKNNCDNNSIVLLSDGKPSSTSSAEKVAALVGPTMAGGCSTMAGFDTTGRCGKELTKFLATTDNSSTVTGDQFIKTHTIGLSLGDSPNSLLAKEYLKELAVYGGGEYLNANTADSLAEALLKTITIATQKARSFSSPTYTNSADSLSHGDHVYVPVFDKSIGPVWSGNLKKYTRGNGRLVDADGDNATDSMGGLLDSARDLWSAVASSSAVNSGGVANKLPDPDSRVLFTDAGVGGAVTFSATNALSSSNTNITKALLGNASMTNTHREMLINFIRGKNTDATSRKHIGDIIHSKPIYVEYTGAKRLYVGTNEGYLHAFDEATGVEKYAFMPSTLLKNIDVQFRYDALADHPYGVDGPITLQHDDANGDGIVNGTDKAVLYFGLRRGGKAYYALDVTNPLAPKLKWKIEQGAGNFSRLGYSWSQPVVTKMKHTANSAAEQVVVFGGGYVNDNGGEADNSGTGADVFIVKASDGSLVWRLSKQSKTKPTNAGVNVKYAVPGNIRVMDITGDSSLDRLYFGDTGGNVWRVDFESHIKGSGAKKAKLKRFAKLGGAAPKRKFFTEPDVALFKAQGRYLISVAIGSGQRPKPLDATTDDNFFLLFDKDVKSIPKKTTPTITKARLKNATAGPVTGAFSGKFRGWFMDLVAVNGEKVLSRATTYNNKILFNTFGVTSTSVGACGPGNVNQSRLYIVDIMDAGGVIDLNNDSTTNPADPADRSIQVAEGEIPGPPHIIMNEPSTCVKGDCVTKDSGGSGKGLDVPFTDSKILRKVFWIDKE